MNGSSFAFEVLLILALILVNGVFAMSEIAIVSSRRTRLEQRANRGQRGAKQALELAEEPTRFLSTVQIGITLVGVFAGAYGGARIASNIADSLQPFTWIAPYREEVALAVVVGAITFLSLVIGELVPKRIALYHPERIATLIAGPMQTLSIIATPVVRLLSASTEFVIRLTGARRSDEPAVTEEDVNAMIDAGTQAGVFDEEEHDLVERVFWLGDQRISALMTPRHSIEWLDVEDPHEVHRKELIRNRHSHYLVCEGDVDHVLGMVRVKDLLAELLEGRPLDLTAAVRRPLFVPEGLQALRLLEMFRETGVHLAIVIDEYGGVEGLVTLNDILEAITGRLAVGPDPRMLQRDDGSWLVDGSVTMDDFWETLGLEERRMGDRRDFHTVGGLVVTTLGRIPQSGSSFVRAGLRFEVVDMDGHRVDKVLVTPERGDEIR